MTDGEAREMARLAQRDERMSTGALYGDLADRIEALIGERDQWRRAAETRAEGWKISDDARIEAEIKLAKAVDALLWCSGSPDFNEGGMAREGWLKLCAPIIFAELTGGKDE
jgi:hypothetical protein